MMTKSHGLENKYDAEDDVKKISKHAQEKENSQTDLEKPSKHTQHLSLIHI